MSNSVVFWYLLISLKATVPGLNLRVFWDAVAGAVFLELLRALFIFFASFDGTFALLFLVRAIKQKIQKLNSKFGSAL
jgi:hypothetical protein